MINLKKCLATAQKNKFAVGAFNAIDSIFVDGIFAAVERTNSPVIINVAEVHLQHISLEEIANYVKYKAEKSAVPVTLNLDHGLSFETCQRAVACGFTSVMFDGSHLSYEENVIQTRKVVEYCHAHNVSVEAELGAVGGDEGGNLFGEPDKALYTDVSQAADFVAQTGVDALAVAIGNSHGKYKGKPQIDLERLSEIATRVDVPLVLHGGSGLSTEDFRRCIERGICKVNFYTGMSQAAIDTIRENMNNEELAQKYDHYLMMMKRVQASVSDAVENQVRIYYSDDKAALYG